MRPCFDRVNKSGILKGSNVLHVYNTCLMPGLLPRAGGRDLLWTWPLATFVGYKRDAGTYEYNIRVHWHKHKQKQKKNGQVCSSCACACAYVVALTRENRVDIITSVSPRPWTNHRSLWPRPHCEHIKSNCPPSCLSSSWGELVSRIESNMPFCACACPPYANAYAYALVKPRL